MRGVRGTFPFVIVNFPIWSDTGWYVWENTSTHLKCDQIVLVVQYQFVSFEDKHDLSLFWNLFILFLRIPASSHRSPVNLWWFDIPLQNNPMQEQCANLLYAKILIWKSLYRLNAIEILFFFYTMPRFIRWEWLSEAILDHDFYLES